MVEVAAASPAERGVLDNLLQLYVHDFSEQWAGTPRGEVVGDGRFEPYPWLASYWSEPGRVPLLLRRDGFLIGFALLNKHAHSGLPLDWSMAEFFILRKHRRSGAGTAAAQTIFRRHPGQWEAAIARRNPAALAFWRKAAASCASVSEIEELDRDDAAWNGPILRFRIG
jgi:predicted acetyltransferase